MRADVTDKQTHSSQYLAPPFEGRSNYMTVCPLLSSPAFSVGSSPWRRPGLGCDSADDDARMSDTYCSQPSFSD